MPGFLSLIGPPDGKSLSDGPGSRRRSSRQFPPKIGSFRRTRQDDTANLPPADQAIVPTEIVIKHEVEGRGLLREKTSPGAILNLRLDTTTPERTDNATIREEQGLRAFLLRTGALNTGNDAEGKRLTFREGSDELIVELRHNECLRLHLNHSNSGIPEARRDTSALKPRRNRGR